jgi:long-chain fatty acid transport protein
MKSAGLFAVVVRSCRWSAGLGLLLGFAAHAEGFRNPPEGGASMGRVGGNIALNDDASAVSRNPANLALMTNAQIQVGANIIHSTVEFTAPLGITDETEDPWKFLPYAFASMPLNEKLALGLGVSFPFGQSTVWPKNGAISASGAPYFAELRVMNVNPTLAAKVGDSLCLAVGVDVYSSDLETRTFLGPLGDQKVDVSGIGVGGNAALTWLITQDQRLALTYRTPVKVNYDGQATVTGLPASDIETEITFPDTIGVGYSMQCTDKLKVEADAEWTQFSRYDNLTLTAENQPPTVIPQNWKDAWTLGVGAEYQLCSAAVLRLGYQFIQSPVPDDTLAPTLPDDDRSVVSVGLGYKQGAHAVDVAFMQSIFRSRTISSPTNPYNGCTYDINSQIIAASYNFSF